MHSSRVTVWAPLALAVALALLCALSVASSDGDEGSDMEFVEDGASGHEFDAHDDRAGDDRAYEAPKGGRMGGSAVAASREQQIIAIEDELDEVRRRRGHPAAERVARLAAAAANAKKAGGWFPSAEETSRMHTIDQELGSASRALAAVQADEAALTARLKPLYGIVSSQFVHEQQQTIQQSLAKVNDMAYNQAWWSSLFGSGRREGLGDLIMQFFVQWIASYVVMYPFAWAYYTFWSAPWSIYAYSGGWTDVLTAIAAWVAASLLMALPMVALLGGGYWMVRNYGDVFVQRAAERRQRAARPGVYGAAYGVRGAY